MGHVKLPNLASGEQAKIRGTLAHSARTKGGPNLSSIENALNEGNDGILFDLGEDGNSEPGKTDSACILVKTRGSLTPEEREFFKKLIQERFKMKDNRIIFIKVPAMEKEPASACILLSIREVGNRLLPYVAEAEDAWDSYKDEYQKRGLTHEEFKQAVIDVTGHLG
jgi:hypothetical protein